MLFLSQEEKFGRLSSCWYAGFDIGNIFMTKQIWYEKRWTFFLRTRGAPYIHTQINCWGHWNVIVKAECDFLPQQELNFWEDLALAWKSGHLPHSFQDIVCIKLEFSEDFWVNMLGFLSVFLYKHLWLFLDFNLDFRICYL